MASLAAERGASGPRLLFPSKKELMTRAYWELIVRGEEFQAPVPSTIEFEHGLPSLARPGQIKPQAPLLVVPFRQFL